MNRTDRSSPRVVKMVQDHYTERDFIKFKDSPDEAISDGFDPLTFIYVRND